MARLNRIPSASLPYCRPMTSPPTKSVLPLLQQFPTHSLIPKPFCRSTWTTPLVNSCLRPRSLIALRRQQISVCSSPLTDDHRHSPSPCLKSRHHHGWCSQLLDGLSLQLPCFSISNLPSSSLSPDTTSYDHVLDLKVTPNYPSLITVFQKGHIDLNSYPSSSFILHLYFR